MNVATLPSRTLLVPAPHAKPCGVLDLNGYFAPLRMMVEEGFLHERNRAPLIFGSTVEDVLLNLQNFHVPLAKY